MGKIIEKLYNVHLQEEQFPFGLVERGNMRKEYEAYCTTFSNASTANERTII